MTDDPWDELKNLVMESARVSLDEIIPPGKDIIQEDGVSVNAEVFKTIWMRGVQLGAELMIMALNKEEYEECDYTNRH